MVKEFLSQNNVEYQERRVDSDRAAFNEFVQLGLGMGVPVTVIDGEGVVGFDQAKIKSLIQ